MTTHRVSSWPVALLALPAVVSIWAGWVGLGGLTGFGRVQLLPGIVDRLVLNTAITLPVGMEAYAAYALRAWLTPTAPHRAREFAKTSAITALTLGCLGQIAYHLMAAAHWTTAPWPITATVSCLPVGVLGMGAALAHLLSNDDPLAAPEPTPSTIEASRTPPPEMRRVPWPPAAPTAVAVDHDAPSRPPFQVVPNLTARGHSHPDTANRPAAAPVRHPESVSAGRLATAPVGRPDEQPTNRPDTASAGRPVHQPANRSDTAPRPAPSTRPASTRRRSPRKSRPKTDEQLAAAVRQMAARNGGAAPSQYQVRQTLGVGGGRAARLVAQLEPNSTANSSSDGVGTPRREGNS